MKGKGGGFHVWVTENEVKEGGGGEGLIRILHFARDQPDSTKNYSKC